MNKNTIYNALLIGCPAAAIVLASGSKSIRIFDKAAQTNVYQSYFALLPESTFQISTVLAMGLAMVTLIFAIVYVVSQNQKWVKCVYLTSFASVFAAEIPTLMQNELFVLPNHTGILVPILLITACAMAYYKMKKPQEEQKKQPKGERLQVRR